MISTQEMSGFPIGKRGQLLLLAFSICLLLGFGLAWKLEPDTRGFGTHQQLGLPPCSLQVMLGVPCPSCGMTTSFSHYVRGNWIDAANANWAGLFLATVCTLLIPWCWISIFQRKLWKVNSPDYFLLILLLLICGFSLLRWGWLLVF